MATLIELRDHHHAVQSCNARCYNSKTPTCTCICNGLNHGVGHTQALTNTRQAGPQAVADYVATHPTAANYKLYLHLPPIPARQPLLF